jgi:hypothetical protein
MVVGRKNHYGSKSQRGTEVAALFYSLIETAKLRGEDPGDYLRLPRLSGQWDYAANSLGRTERSYSTGLK